MLTVCCSAFELSLITNAEGTTVMNLRVSAARPMNYSDVCPKYRSLILDIKGKINETTLEDLLVYKIYGASDRINLALHLRPKILILIIELDCLEFLIGLDT